MSGECTCRPPGKRPAIEHARGCPRRARRTVPLTTLSVGDQLGPAAGDTRTDRGRLREAVVRGLGALTSVRVNVNRPGEVPGHWTGHLTKPETERIADAVLATPEVAALLDAAEKVRELHRPYERWAATTWINTRETACAECLTRYPCKTIRALNGDAS